MKEKYETLHGNMNAAKPESEKIKSNLNIRCHTDELLNWRESANKSGKPLSAWVRERLNRDM